MKLTPPRSAPHPDVDYWKCPHGDALVWIEGRIFTPLLGALGMTVETSDLVRILPVAVLAEAEHTVERHELTHHGITPSSGDVAA